MRSHSQASHQQRHVLFPQSLGATTHLRLAAGLLATANGLKIRTLRLGCCAAEDQDITWRLDCCPKSISTGREMSYGPELESGFVVLDIT